MNIAMIEKKREDKLNLDIENVKDFCSYQMGAQSKEEKLVS